MGFGTYKLKRLLSFGLVGIIPTLICFVLLFLQFPLMGILLWSLITAGILIAIGYIITGMNPWIKAIQGNALIVIDVNSTGIGKFYNARVINNPLGGIDLEIDFGNNQKETRAYDRIVTHRIQSPLKLIMQPWNRKKQPVKVEDGNTQ